MNTNQTAAQVPHWVVMLLALVAGFVDAFGFLSYRAYLSLMSGNTTQSGFLIGQGGWSEAVPTLLAIVCFVAGVFAGTLLNEAGSPRRRRLVFGCVAALLGIDLALTLTFKVGILLPIGLLSVAMGMMNTTVSRIGGESVNLTFVTGTLNRIGNHLALAVRGSALKEAQGSGDSHVGRAVLLAGMWLSFFLGAILGGVANPAKSGPIVLVFPLAVLTLLALLPNWMGERKAAMNVSP
jgi:uncharacterized membrane protein YoaK (UPF0700 family)